MSSHESYIQALLDTYPLREPVLRSVIHALQLPRASHGLDVGCGIGLPTFLLAEAIGREGRVTGTDILPALLKFAQDQAASAGLSERVTFRQGDMGHLPFASNTFDWAWSVDCVGYPAGDLAPLLAELMRVVKPGGQIALLGWSSQQFLPGYPVLEAHLNATWSGYFPFLKDQAPERHFLRALSCLREAGLEAAGARTFVGDICAPLTGGQQIALTALFRQLWEEPQAAAVEDLAGYGRLCLPGSPDFILGLPDYYAFFTYSMFAGRVPARSS